MNEREVRVDLEVDGAKELVAIEPPELARVGEARIADEEPDVETDGAVDHRRDAARIAEVGAHRSMRDAVLVAELLPELVESLFAPRDEHDVDAARRDRACDLASDARGRTGDDGPGAEALGVDRAFHVASVIARRRLAGRVAHETPTIAAMTSGTITIGASSPTAAREAAAPVRSKIIPA
jgi:hypothetical protein